MIPAKFDYYAPTTLDEAVALLNEHEFDAKILAGGQSLIPAMRFRLAVPEILIDINGLEDLRYIKEENGHLVIGAMTTEAALDHSAVVQEKYSLLADAVRVIADPLVRNRATVGGNIAHADPANDQPATMLAYNANLVAVGPDGQRVIPIDEFFVDLFENALEDTEILTEIRIPTPGPNTGGAYQKIERKVGDYAIAAVAVQITLDGDTCTDIRIGLTNVSPVPMRAKNAEAALKGQNLSEDNIRAAAKAAAEECDPAQDLRGTVDYKRDLVRVLTMRTLHQAIKRAQS